MQKLGKYEIVEKIGIGGFGVVYKGYDPFIKRHVAIKTCSVEDRETRERFHREAEIAGNLQHRNIVTVFEFGFEQETPYLVQEYLSGEDLDRKIKRNEYVPLPEKILWLVQVARGLEYAHAAGIVHRDIKPGNVRILEDGTAKILDFGIAKLTRQQSTLTQAGITLGTAAYLAPEQIRGEAVDARTDVFSFGVLAYELLAHQRPFRAAEISAIFYKILHDKPEPLAGRVPDLPVELDRIVARCLDKIPARRWAPTSELVRALELLMQRRPGSVTTDAARAAARAGDTRTTPTAPAASTAVPPGPRSVSNRPALDELEFRHAESSPRVQSRSMATTAFGVRRPRSWLRWIGALAAAAALGAVALFLAQSAAQRAGTPAAPPKEPVGAPAEPAAAPADPRPAPRPSGASATAGPAAAGAPVQAPTPAPAAEPAPPPEPEPARLILPAAWDPAMQVRVGGRRLRLDRERSVELPAGSHTLVFSLDGPGYSFTRERKVRVGAGATQRVTIPIERPGRLTIQPHLDTPPGTVRLDGRMVGAAPVRSRWLEPGEHVVEIFPATGVTAAPSVTRTVTVRSDVETVLTFDLDGRLETQVRERSTAGG